MMALWLDDRGASSHDVVVACYVGKELECMPCVRDSVSEGYRVCTVSG
jgi:hypothetical protein